MKKHKICVVSDYAYPSGGIEVFIDEVLLATKKELKNIKLVIWRF